MRPLPIQKEAYELLIIFCDDRIWEVADTAFVQNDSYLAVLLWLSLNCVVLLSFQDKVEHIGVLRLFWRGVYMLCRELQTVIIWFALKDKPWL